MLCYGLFIAFLDCLLCCIICCKCGLVCCVSDVSCCWLHFVMLCVAQRYRNAVHSIFCIGWWCAGFCFIILNTCTMYGVALNWAVNASLVLCIVLLSFAALCTVIFSCVLNCVMYYVLCCYSVGGLLLLPSNIRTHI